MAHQTLHRRRTQLELLAEACRKQTAALIASCAEPARTHNSSLLALDDDGVIVAWDAGGGQTVARPGQEVFVDFTHDGEPYRMVTRTRTRLGCAWMSGGAAPALRLNLPLRIERRSRRRSRRISLRAMTPVVARFTSMLDTARTFEARIMDVSAGGIGVLAGVELPSELRGGEPFWVEFELPGAARRFEFAARLVHQRTTSDNGITQGWTFQPGDDAGFHEESFRRLEQFVQSDTPS